MILKHTCKCWKDPSKTFLTRWGKKGGEDQKIGYAVLVVRPDPGSFVDEHFTNVNVLLTSNALF